jgi:hypothetical protein
MTFEEIYPLVSKDEGGYSNKPNDRGGETYGGIARNYPQNKSWEGWQILDEIKAKSGVELPNNFRSPILDDLVKDFFKEKNWDAVQMDNFPESLRYCIFDVIVNFGFDPDTLASKAWAFIRLANGDNYNSSFVADLFWTNVTPENYTQARKNQYRRIVQANPSQQEFLKGWLIRADGVLLVTRQYHPY